MIKKGGVGTISVPQELVFEAQKNVNEKNFNLALLLTQNINRCQMEGDCQTIILKKKTFFGSIWMIY